MNAKSIIGLVLMALVAGCASNTPPTKTEQTALLEKSDATLAAMQKMDPSLKTLLRDAYAYAIFPSASKGGLIAGGAYGRGIVYRHGVATGYADLSQATLGGQIGGQTFSELLVFENQDAFDLFRSGKLTLELNTSAVALDRTTKQRFEYRNGILVFTRPEGGLMAEATVGGQQFTFVPIDDIPQ